MYKIHLENREPPQPIKIAGRLIETHTVPETPPLLVVETKDDAREAIQTLIAQGIPASELYAVGYDPLLAESVDA
jgi:hypothetical protein